ncbi:MAG: ABC transporter ATP-binding protein [Melioribacteraceae bacterium]|nr:ABC transporter ATP-binding protein [Melioribacteraceae bacterium]MCF8262877.1 ABC transporter ATP-binding protein [Melioribacteraceae bacterium]MCF8430895.1 ABC transporter ATP-binding protein [Melioribacteraceae bacterium]
MIAIKVTDISKKYRLGVFSSQTLSQDISRWLATLKGKEDPLGKLGGSESRKKDKNEYVWALKDINFDVNEGEVFGIIGKNGAGKSTLLKILSRITGPTTGVIKARGRIASLLEVGTGFHPELTGRENTFLNGAILGMKKSEIHSKFEEIVEFSGVEKYIDTPVKRYSSGMYVRLAFAVAAHLEPEILIIDEVLAVGDAEFQEKAFGKMKAVSSGEGRTVLFVSHNMGAVEKLCNRVLFLEDGRKVRIDQPGLIIEQYLSSKNTQKVDISDYIKVKSEYVDVNKVEINGASNLKLHFEADDINLEIALSFTLKKQLNITFFMRVFDHLGVLVGSFFPERGENLNYTFDLAKGEHTIVNRLKFPNLSTGKYFVSFGLSRGTIENYLFFDKAVQLDITGNTTSSGRVFNQTSDGYFLLEGKAERV